MRGEGVMEVEGGGERGGEGEKGRVGRRGKELLNCVSGNVPGVAPTASG